MARIDKILTQKTVIGVLTPVIAIVLALLVGGVIIFVFITSFHLTDEVFARLETKLAQQGFSSEILTSIESLKGQEYASRTDLENAFLQKMESFQLTQVAFERLKPGDIPEDIRQKLQPLTEEPLLKQSKFLQTIRALIGKEDLLKYRSVLLKAADQHVDVRRTIMKMSMNRENPVDVYKVVFQESLGTKTGWGEVLFRATPLIFTGLAVAFAFQCGLFNIGGEGQMVMGGFATAWFGFTFTNLPSFLLVPICIVMGAAVGAIWGGIPGFLKAKLGVSEVVNTIMMNWIAVALIQYLTMRYKEPDDMIPQTAEIADAAKLPRLYKYFSAIFPKHVHLNVAIFVALIAVIALAYLLTRTKIGYEIRAVGLSAAAAECAGISVAKNTILAMAISGAVAGLVGVNQVMGEKYRFLYDLFDGKGFDGIGVALIGKNNPYGVVLGAILFGVLEFGGFSASVKSGGRVPREIIMILKAIILIFVVISGEITKRLMIFLQKRKGGQA